MLRDEVQGWQAVASVIDVRPRLEYDYGHIPGAESVPFDEIAGAMIALPPGRPLIVYSRSAYCPLAPSACELLRAGGFEAQRLDGGWSEWRAERRAIETAEPAGATAPA